jgi:ActR/RegA family two-component response regulator
VRSLLGPAAALGSSAADGSRPDPGGPLDLDTLERRHIERVLEMTAGNKTAAARVLGVTRRTLQRKGY